jgi:hypothetical protein
MLGLRLPTLSRMKSERTPTGAFFENSSAGMTTPVTPGSDTAGRMRLRRGSRRHRNESSTILHPIPFVL